jgi:hypothetical protein
MTKDSKVHLKNCLLIENGFISLSMYSLIGLMDKVLAYNTGGPWIKSWGEPFFDISKKP